MKQLLFLASLWLATFTAAAQAKKAGEIVSIQQIDIRGEAKPGSNIVAVVTVAVEKGVYLNSNRPPSPQLLRTDAQVFSVPAVKTLPVVFSSGSPKVIPGFKDPVPVYEESFTFTVPLMIHPNAVLPATLAGTMSYQATRGTVRQPAGQLRFNLVVPKATNAPPAK